MKEFYELFVDLSLKQCKKNDYANKLKVKMHNAASKKLKQLQAEMKKCECEEILTMLLLHEDDRVKTNAASLCLQMNVLLNQAENTLRNIIDISDDPTLRFSAKRLLMERENGPIVP